MRYAKRVIYKDRRGEYRWRLVAPNGALIAESGEGYSTRSNCVRAYDRVARYIFSGSVERV